MLVCKHCLSYLMSTGQLKNAMVSTEPAWVYDEDEEITACEWCESDEEEELYLIEWK